MAKKKKPLKEILGKIRSSLLLRDSAIYGITNALYAGLPLFILPIFTTLLSPEDYGLIEFYRNLSMVLIPILGLSTVQSIIRYFYDLEEGDFKVFVSNIISLHFVNAIFGILFLFSISYLISEEYWFIIFYCIIFFLSNQIIEILLSIYRAQKKPKNFFLIRVTCIIIDLVLMYFFYSLIQNFDWTFRVLPNVFATSLISLLSLGILFKNKYLFKFDKKLLFTAVAYSSPLILHMISGYILNIGDRFFILYFLSEKDLGNYAVSYQLGMLGNFFFTSFNLAWVPIFFEMLKKKQISRIRKIKKISYYLIVIFSTLMLFLVYALLKFSPFFEKYSIQIELVAIISIAYIFISFYKFESNYFFYSKNTKSLSIVTLGGALITIFLNLFLIDKIGIYGCAIATFVAALFMFLMVKVKADKYEKNFFETEE